jgi:hypothetical protein
MMTPPMLKRLKIQIKDFVRFNPAVRNFLASYILLQARRVQTAKSGDAVRIIQKLCQAARLAATDSMMLKAEAAIARQVSAIDPQQIPWGKFLPDFGSNRINKAIVLKRYVSAREKGVVFVSFDNQMARLANGTDLRQFAERYTLVLSPQWSPPHTVASYLFPLLYPDHIFCLISNLRDLGHFPRINDKYRMVPLYASNWVDPHKYSPVNFTEKDIDIFMLANFAQYKRHHALFAALRDLPRNYRVVLVGRRESGRSKESLLNEAEAFGVRDRFEIRENVSDEELQNTLVRAKTSLILSRREGSCVAVVESMFANTPVGVYEDAEVGSRVFVNEHTGRLLRRRDLAGQLKDFVDSSAKYEPRRWVMENGVSCIASSQVLNDVLKQSALNTGGEWSEDIATLRWRPNPQYCDPCEAGRLRSSYEDIERRCNITIGEMA